MTKEKACGKCRGKAMWWERGKPLPWRPLHMGVVLNEYGMAEEGGSKLIFCEECKGSGKAIPKRW